MDMRSRLLALVVVCLFAAAVAGTALALRRAASQAEQEIARWQTAPLPRTDAERISRETPSARAQDFSNPRAEMMEAQVERLAARVSRLTEQLDKKSSENDVLRADLERAARQMNELLSTGPATVVPSAGGEATPTRTPNKSSEEMLAEMTTQLRELREELEALEKSAELDGLQILDLENRRRYLQTAASAAIVRSGVAAVPALCDLLGDQRREIRRWSAELLGEIGPDAHDAIDVLQDAISDSDEEVRLAARKALRRIEKP